MAVNKVRMAPFSGWTLVEHNRQFVQGGTASW
jgi:hypothetical protein